MSSRRSVPEVWAEAQIPMFVCRHCGVFVYSPPIPHRFGVPGESCAEERVEITQVVDAFAAAKITELERDFHELEREAEKAHARADKLERERPVFHGPRNLAIRDVLAAQKRAEAAEAALWEITRVKDMPFAFMAAHMRQIARKALFEVEERDVPNP